MVDQTRINNGKVESPNAEIDLATLLTADISELTGSISDQPITQIDGGGLEHDGNGRLQVDSSYFDGSISGLSNPLSADLDAADYNISNAGSIDSQSVNTEKAQINKVAGVAERSNSTQTIPTETVTQVDFDGTVFDQFNAFDVSNNEFVAPEDGTYYFHVIVGWDSPSFSGDRVQLDFRGSGITAPTRKDDRDVTKSSPFTVQVETIDNMAAGETVHPAVFQTSGVSQDLSSAPFNNNFRFARLG